MRLRLFLPLMFVVAGVAGGCNEKRDDESGRVQLRSGLPRLQAKLAERAPVVVAFLGGSITENAGEGGFLTGVADWFASRGIPVRIVNAGLSATDSKFGALRLQRDVLVHRPDVVFVEFAVNDNARDSRGDMEKIVRDIRKETPAPDVVFLYAMTDRTWRAGNEASRKFIAAHEKVANRYGVPTVHLGATASARLKSRKWKWRDFSRDTCHPTPAGYATYHADMVDAMDRLIKARAKAVGIPANPHFYRRADVEPNGVQSRKAGMPWPGVTWIESPQATTDLGEWELLFRRSDEPVSSLRPARWFPEAEGFTGSSSRLLFETEGKPVLRSVPSRSKGGDSTTNVLESPVVVWTVRKGGFFDLELSLERFDGHKQSPEARAALEFVRLESDGSRGEIIASLPTDRNTLRARQSVNLQSGERLAAFLVSDGYEFLSAVGLEWSIVRSDSDF